MTERDNRRKSASSELVLLTIDDEEINTLTTVDTTRFIQI
jgi:hypothetical protein